MTEPDERRRRGIEMMKQVYGWDIGEVHGAFVEQTVDHLFGEVWAEGTLSVRERRLVLLGLLVGSGQDDVVGLQLDCALSIGEMTEDELRELTVFLAHYAGWPSAAKFNQHVEELSARRANAARTAAEQAASAHEDETG
jgi:4-carboxymuconolactone decarboxylase